MSKSCVGDFRKAYHKVRSWEHPVVPSLYRAVRYALLGDTGLFRTHGGWRISRIRRMDEDEQQ